MNKSDVAIFTVTNIAYLHKALVLARSIQQYNHEVLNIYIIDRKVDINLPEKLANFVWIEDLNIDKFLNIAFKYDITELSTSVKPLITLDLLQNHHKVLFFDPDIRLYASVSSIIDLLDDDPIILTPHYTTPQDPSLENSDVGMLRFGSFNLGFFAVNRSNQSNDFLAWWHSRCMHLCYFETQFGLSTDQKWVSIAPCLFPQLKISFDLGYNVAFWNMHERVLSRNSSGNVIINGEYPLIFFHFSSFHNFDPHLLSTRPFAEKNTSRNDWYQLAKDYQKELLEFKKIYEEIKYGYDYMSDGSYISPTLRRAYASIEKEISGQHDPFDSNGLVHAFAKSNHLLSKHSAGFTPLGFEDKDIHKYKMKMIYLALRFILLVLGPNAFSNFSRLLVYLSSYRQNRGLWKYSDKEVRKAGA